LILQIKFFGTLPKKKAGEQGILFLLMHKKAQQPKSATQQVMIVVLKPGSKK
jgi:hypothetical protein